MTVDSTKYSSDTVTDSKMFPCPASVPLILGTTLGFSLGSRSSSSFSPYTVGSYHPPTVIQCGPMTQTQPISEFHPPLWIQGLVQG